MAFRRTILEVTSDDCFDDTLPDTRRHPQEYGEEWLEGLQGVEELDDNDIGFQVLFGLFNLDVIIQCRLNGVCEKQSRNGKDGREACFRPPTLAD